MRVATGATMQQRAMFLPLVSIVLSCKSPTESDAPLVAAIDDYLYFTRGVGLVVAAEGPEGRRAYARGAADLAGSELSPTALFRIASITKTFIAVATLKLVEQGRVSLDDKLTHWIP